VHEYHPGAILEFSRALLALTPQWQPIETAPKTANTIWVCCADALAPRAGPAHWRGEWRAGTAEDWQDDGAAEKWGTYPAPTHWMPLPAPPAA
jgi:hypothetical protein